MLLREQPGEKAAKILRLIRNSTMRMSGLIDNVLDFARGKLGGGLSVTLEKGHSLAPTLEQIIAEFRAIAPERVIEANIQLDSPVAVDRPRVGQLLSNLLGNAITHGNPGQPIASLLS